MRILSLKVRLKRNCNLRLIFDETRLTATEGKGGFAC